MLATCAACRSTSASADRGARICRAAPFQTGRTLSTLRARPRCHELREVAYLMHIRLRYTCLAAGATAAGVVLICYVAAGPQAGGVGADLLANQGGAAAGGWAKAVSAAGGSGGGTSTPRGRHAVKARLQAAQAYATHPAVPRQAHV